MYNIKFLNPSEEVMRKNKFTDVDPRYWHYHDVVYQQGRQKNSFNIWVHKKTGEVDCQVIDELFMSPSFAMSYDNQFSQYIKAITDSIIGMFIDKGIFKEMS